MYSVRYTIVMAFFGQVISKNLLGLWGESVKSC